MSVAATKERPNTNTPRSVVVEGNEAAAISVGLSRPDVVAVYPITPQSSLVEHLSQMIADGRLNASLMNVEGEHAVLNGLQGVALAGGRTFTATSGPGIAFMFEPYVRTPGLRLPMVASLVTRDLLSPQCVWGGQQDAMVVREAGWIQMHCETVQEILDTTVMAYKIAEHRDVMLPVNVCHDGNYLSFGVTRVELPEQDEVDNFLGAAVDQLAYRARSRTADGRRSADRRRRRHPARAISCATARASAAACRTRCASSARCMRSGPRVSAAATRRSSRSTGSTTPTTRSSPSAA